MKKRLLRILCFVMLLCMAGCGSPSAEEPNQEDSMKTSAVITGIHGNTILIRAMGERGQDMSLPAKWLEGKAEPKEGMILEITSTNEILEIYPCQFAKILSVEVAGFEEPKEKSGMISAPDEDDTLSGEGSLPTKSETEEGDTSGQGEKSWKKLVIAPPEGSYCNISLSLPENWGWSCSQSEDVPVSDINLSIYPKAEGDAKGCISIQYAKGFGVCGTGLESEATTFNGHTATKGTYDGHSYWDFIALSEEYRGCAIVNCAGSTWFAKYEKELEEILATVEYTLSDGTPLKEFSQEDIGEIYAKDPTKDDIVVSVNGMKYVRNQLLISAKLDGTREEIENLGSAYGFEIVGYIELTQDYQSEFTRDMEESELQKMIKILEEEDCVSMCSYNYVMDISYD